MSSENEDFRESKIDLTDRLRAEGRWEEASAYRDEVRRKLRAEGKPAAEAREAAWDAVREKYPPLDAHAATGDDGQQGEPPDAVTAWPDADAPPDLVRDILWTYRNLENKQVAPANAPGPGAWSLLLWARQYRNRFFEQLLPKALVARAGKDDSATQVEEREEKSISELRRVLRRFLEPDADDSEAQTENGNA